MILKQKCIFYNIIYNTGKKSFPIHGNFKNKKQSFNRFISLTYVKVLHLFYLQSSRLFEEKGNTFFDCGMELTLKYILRI